MQGQRTVKACRTDCPRREGRSKQARNGRWAANDDDVGGTRMLKNAHASFDACTHYARQPSFTWRAAQEQRRCCLSRPRSAAGCHFFVLFFFPLSIFSLNSCPDALRVLRMSHCSFAQKRAWVCRCTRPRDLLPEPHVIASHGSTATPYLRPGGAGDPPTTACHIAGLGGF